MSNATPSPSVVRPSAPHLVLLWTFRLLSTVQAIVFLLQPVSIGSFLQGSYEAMTLHSIAGSILVPVTMFVGALGAVLAIVGRRWWLLGASVVLVVATTMQVGLGYTRLLSLHVPLGVLLVALALWLAGWSWTKGVAR